MFIYDNIQLRKHNVISLNKQNWKNTTKRETAPQSSKLKNTNHKKIHKTGQQYKEQSNISENRWKNKITNLKHFSDQVKPRHNAENTIHTTNQQNTPCNNVLEDTTFLK